MNIRSLFGGCACAALIVGALTPTTTSATTLFDLIPGGSITVGSLTFSDFSYLGTGSMPTAAGVNVTTYVDPSTNDVGLKFQGSFLDFPGGGSDAPDRLQGHRERPRQVGHFGHLGRKPVGDSARSWC